MLIFYYKIFAGSKKRHTFALAIENNSGCSMQNKKFGVVVQLVRIHACHAWGRGFESRPHRQITKAPEFKNFGAFLFSLLFGNNG